jgi:hemerythrin-like domain-containing protein
MGRWAFPTHGNSEKTTWGKAYFRILLDCTDSDLQTKPKTEPGAILSATEMALIHNVFIRILNCIYLQAPNVKEEKDISDFIVFTYAWIITLHEHHGNEEKLFFPWLEADIGTKGAMEKNVEQHHVFEPGMSALEAYVVAVKDGKEKYDGAKIVALIDVFGSILAKHLAEEIGTFEELEKLGDKIDWKAWNKKVQKVAVDTAEKVCVALLVSLEERS